jgi:colanic acid biosynthesis glycosyl transferase WcaI
MRLVVLTQYYPPETGAPQRRLGDLARRLAARGHQVQVVTAMPNYPAGQLHEQWRGRLLGRESIDGVDVLRSALYVSPVRTTARQLATYFSFALSSGATAPVRLRKADVVLWESPPLFLAPTATLLSRRLGARLVMNVSDLWPRSAVELGVLRDPRLISFFERWERRAYRSADLVTHQTEGIGAGVEARAPGTARMLFPNGVDTLAFTRVEPRPGLGAELGVPATGAVVGYAGNFGRGQALEQVVDAAALVPEATFVLVGDGPRREYVVDRIAALGAGNVVVSPSVPAERMSEVLSLFDLAVVPLAGIPLFDGARPSKLFELLALGVPVVYCGRGEGASIAQASGGAVVVPPEDPPALAQAVRGLLAAPPATRRRMGDAGRRYVEQHFDRAVIAGLVEDRLLTLASAPQRRR